MVLAFAGLLRKPHGAKGTGGGGHTEGRKPGSWEGLVSILLQQPTPEYLLTVTYNLLGPPLKGSAASSCCHIGERPHSNHTQTMAELHVS